MTINIICQGPGYTIARDTEAGTLVPYGYVKRSDGAINHGWVDLSERPDLVDSIPEAKKSEGLATLLRVVAHKSSRIMSGACECGAFDRPDAAVAERWQVGGFVSVMFRNADMNANADNLLRMAEHLLSMTGPSPGHAVMYELTIEPLKLFFDRMDCFCLMVKPLGHGATEPEAWAAFDAAASALATAIERSRAQAGRVHSSVASPVTA